MVELEKDTKHVFSLIKQDYKYEQLLGYLKHHEAMKAVAEAFNLLHSDPGPKKEGALLNLTPEGCMVVSLIQQLLIRMFTKRLINLISPEAFILNQNKISHSYLFHYLKNQSHFSLKKMIESYYKDIR